MGRMKGRHYGFIGQIIAMDLSLAQFQARYGTGWVLADGSSCAGSTYATITGQTVTPNMIGRAAIGSGTYSDPVAGSTTRTFRNTGGAATHLLSSGESALPSHTHTVHIVGGGNWSFGGNNWAIQWTDPTGNPKQSTDAASANASSAHNNMPPWYAANVFIRIN